MRPSPNPTAGGRCQTSAAAAVSVLAAALLAGAALAGCSTSTAATPSPTSDAKAQAPAAWPDPVPTSGLAKGLVLPLEAYMETYPESVAIQQALNHLTSQCMARYGFQVTLPPPGRTPPPNNDDSNMVRRYGIMDRAQAAKLAYTLGDEDELGAKAPKLSDAALAVLSGRTAKAKALTTYQGKSVPDGGCSTEAATRVGSARIDTSLVDRLDTDSLNKSEADPKVQVALGAWSQCMKAKGYTVDSPMRAPDLAPAVHGQPVSSASIGVATADVDCKSQTGLVKTWFGVESAMQRQQVEQNKSALHDARATITTAVEAAAAVAG